ncbi:MAG: acetate--CoA ligase family protein [Rhodospirillaceae bacterium]|nr:acetate--CoA ligase family protein [Rhodospirillaceae bacterium]
MSDAIQSLLFPKSIAIVGASPDSNKLNGRPFHFLRRDGYAGRLYPVNPKYDEIDGVTCYPDIDALPETPDMAIIAVAASRATEAVAALGRKGTPVAVIFSSGYGETGEAGRLLEEDLAEVARQNGIRICGPNNLGLINAFERMPATFSQYADKTPMPGPVAFASQSGAFGTGIAALARSRGIGLGYFVNTGNQADITLMETLDVALDDPRIKVASAYLEGLKGAGQLIDLAEKSLALSKPLVVAKVGRKAAGVRAAASHTGSLAGEDAVFDGIARQHGIIRARNEEHMLDLVSALSFGPIPKGRGIALITQSGGSGVMMADRAEEIGLNVPELKGTTREKLADVIPEFGALGNPIDVTGQFLADPKILSDSVRIVLDDPDVHIAVVWLQLMHGYADMLIDVFRELRESVDKPFIVCWIEAPEKARIALRDAGICVLPATERSVDAAAGLVAFGEAQRRRSGTPKQKTVFHDNQVAAPSSPVPSLEAGKRLQAAGLQLAECKLALNAQEAAAAAGNMGFPVAVKIESPDILHKMDIGGVQLGLMDEEAVRAAGVEILDSVAKLTPEAQIDGLLIQAMATPTTEIVVGLRQDPAFGPVIMVGLGGIFVEVLKDVAFARAPVSIADAGLLLDSLTGSAILEGVRGQRPVDRGALTMAISQLSDFALANPDVVELDLNPVFAGPDGVIAVDWLMMSTAGQRRS